MCFATNSRYSSGNHRGVRIPWSILTPWQSPWSQWSFALLSSASVTHTRAGYKHVVYNIGLHRLEDAQHLIILSCRTMS